MQGQNTEPLIAALGGTLGIIGALMERANVASLDQFASALGVYGSVTKETDPDAAAIIGQWVATLYDLAAAQTNRN